jgi:hypothetical protein
MAPDDKPFGVQTPSHRIERDKAACWQLRSRICVDLIGDGALYAKEQQKTMAPACHIPHVGGFCIVRADLV